MDTLPLLLSDVARWYAVSAVAVGIRAGLVDALLAGGGTADELAAAAGTDADATARWADAMVTAGYATLADGRYAPQTEALSLLEGGLTIDMRAVVELLVPAGALLGRTVTAIRDGAGIGSDEFQATLGMTVERVNAPLYRALLVSEWIAGHPELESALRDGIDVAEIGPGSGTALRILAAAFPASRFTGFDIDAPTVAEANAAASAEGLANLRFEVRDARAMPSASFDLVCIFDTFHHFTDPDAVLEAMRVALRPDGSILMAEGTLSGDAAADAASPTAVLTYASDLIYCYQESKVAGRPGLGATWAGRGLAAMLERHGFAEQRRLVSRGDYVVIRATSTAALL